MPDWGRSPFYTEVDQKIPGIAGIGYEVRQVKEVRGDGRVGESSIQEATSELKKRYPIQYMQDI